MNMKLKYNFVINEVADKIVAVAVGEDIDKFNGFIKMNETGAQIFNLLKEEITMEALISEMAKLYPEETIETVNLSFFLNYLVSAKNHTSYYKQIISFISKTVPIRILKNLLSLSPNKSTTFIN